MKKLCLSAILLIVNSTLFSQKTVDEVLLLNNEPRRHHHFKTDINLFYYKQKEPESKVVDVTIDSNLIRITNDSDFKIELPISGVGSEEFLNQRQLLFVLKNGDSFFLSWDEKRQAYSFAHFKYYKKFTKKRNYFPLIEQKAIM